MTKRFCARASLNPARWERSLNTSCHSGPRAGLLRSLFLDWLSRVCSVADDSRLGFALTFLSYSHQDMVGHKLCSGCPDVWAAQDKGDRAGGDPSRSGGLRGDHRDFDCGSSCSWESTDLASHLSPSTTLPSVASVASSREASSSLKLNIFSIRTGRVFLGLFWSHISLFCGEPWDLLISTLCRDPFYREQWLQETSLAGDPAPCS